MKNKTAAWFKPAKHIDKNKQAVVIGGGIAGSQIAWHLAERGWQVKLIERHAQIATEASGNKAGVISPKMTAKPSLGEDFYRSCFQYAIQQLQSLEQQKYNFDWDMCGVLQLNHDDREEKRWKMLKNRKFPSVFLQCINAEEASKVAGISLKMGATYFPQGAWIDPNSLCHALCSHKNIEVILHTEALSLYCDKGYWTVKGSEKQTLAISNTAILANGKDIQQFAQAQHLPFMPVQGQTSEAYSSSFTQSLKTVIGHKGYLTPPIHNKHIFGATFERNITLANLSKTADSTNLLQLEHYLPEFAKKVGEISSSHAAIRMTTPDRLPYVGAMPNHNYYQTQYRDISKGRHWKEYPDAQYQSGLFVFAGHASRGITTTGLTANYLASLINNETFTLFSSEIKAALHTARFDIRQLKQKQITPKEA